MLKFFPSHELNLAATDSPLTIIHHYQPDIEEETDAQALKVNPTTAIILYTAHNSCKTAVTECFLDVRIIPIIWINIY